MFCNEIVNSTTIQIWIQLADSAGKPYKNTGARIVSIPSNADVDDLLGAVTTEYDYPGYLKGVDACEIYMYKNQAALDANEPVDVGSDFSDLSLGRSMKDALIVVVPSLPVAVPLNQQTSLSFMLSDESCPILSFPKDNNNVLVKIPWSYIKDSGLTRREKAVLVLYRRPEFEKQWNEMTTYVIKHNVVLWLLGPPGTGKSCTAFAFACSLDRSEWNIVWIHYSKEEADFNCVKFDGDRKLTCTVSRDDSYQMISLLISTKKTIVIFDGYVESMKNMKETHFVPLLRKWRKADTENRRLLCVGAALVSLGKDYKPEIMNQISVKIHDQDPFQTKIFEEMTHTVKSWTLDDYKAAFNVEEFRNSVKDKFRMNRNDANGNELYETVEKKFVVVGGSARLMFDLTLDMAIKVLSNF